MCDAAAIMLVNRKVLLQENIATIAAEDGVGISLTDKRDTFLCQSIIDERAENLEASK